MLSGVWLFSEDVSQKLHVGLAKDKKDAGAKADAAPTRIRAERVEPEEFNKKYLLLEYFSRVT
jgi:GTP cyclohydrolase III